MFPNVQFVVTTHSPLFVLGMQRVFGEDGFALYRLPQGHRISPEEFSELGDAYRAFTETVRFSNDMRAAVEGAQKPIVYVEGSTGQRYIQRAAQLLSQEAILEGVELRDGGGTGDLKNIWKSWLPDLVPQKVMLLFDCEEQLSPAHKGSLLRRAIPLQQTILYRKASRICLLRRPWNRHSSIRRRLSMLTLNVPEQCVENRKLFPKAGLSTQMRKPTSAIGSARMGRARTFSALK